MATSGSGAVFFLGTRAHYQVLNQPESRFDVENGNASTETIYQNPSVQELWPRDQNSSVTSVQELWPRDQNPSVTSVPELWPRDQNSSVTSVQELWPRDQNPSVTSVQELWPREQKLDVDNERWGYCDQTEVTVADDRDKTEGIARRRASETVLCDRDEMKPALLNAPEESTPEKKCGKAPLLAFLWSLAGGRRKRKLDSEENYMHEIDSVLGCTYRESCRCLDCQSRYFEVDEDEDAYDSDDSNVARYVAEMMDAQHKLQQKQLQREVRETPDDDDDEVFVDTVPGDNTSTDLLLETKMSTSSDSEEELPPTTEEGLGLQLEVAAGTPVLLNYLLTHPITCSIQ